MRFDLAALVRRTSNPRRAVIPLREIVPTATMAGDLLRAAYLPVVLTWERAVERVARRYEMALPIRDGFADSLFDLESILAEIEAELGRLVVAITPSLRDWAVRTERWHRGRWRGAILTATGIDADTLLSAGDMAETVSAFVARNVGLVRFVSDEARTRIGDIVLRNYQQRTPVAVVAKEMKEAVGLSRRRAIRIVADQNTKLAARLDQARQQEAGLDRFRWRHSRKLHPRREHQAHDGKVYAWAEPPMLDGKPDLPGQLPFCGCRAQAVLKLNRLVPNS